MQRPSSSRIRKQATTIAKGRTRSKKQGSKQKDVAVNTLENIQSSIDFLIAILLLSGQITTTGLFIVPEGLAFSTSGDVFGFTRNKGKSEALSLDMDFIDVVSALLLILGQIRVQGPYFAGTGLFVVYSGPIFGYKSVPGIITKPSPKALALGQVMREMILERLEQRSEATETGARAHAAEGQINRTE